MKRLSMKSFALPTLVLLSASSAAAQNYTVGRTP